MWIRWGRRERKNCYCSSNKSFPFLYVWSAWFDKCGQIFDLNNIVVLICLNERRNIFLCINLGSNGIMHILHSKQGHKKMFPSRLCMYAAQKIIQEVWNVERGVPARSHYYSIYNTHKEGKTKRILPLRVIYQKDHGFHSFMGSQAWGPILIVFFHSRLFFPRTAILCKANKICENAEKVEMNNEWITS